MVSSPTAFLFGGHGSQYEGMGEELFTAQPVFREALEQCDAVLADDLTPGLLDILYGSPDTRSLVHRVEYGNVVFFALEWALARLWMSWGVKPAYVIGHSVGEYAAACVAGVFSGVFSMEDGLRLVAGVGRLQRSLSPGYGMLAVGASAERVVDTLGTDHPGACIAAVNGPASVVLAAERAGIEKLRTLFEAECVRTSVLKVTLAFHSPHMTPILDDLHGLTRSLRLSPPSIPYFSCLTGAPASDELLNGEYWVRHLGNPVRFLDGMRSLLAEGPEHFIEIGPASTLLRMGQQCASSEQRRNANWIPSIRPDGSDCAIMSAGLAKVTGQGTGVAAPVARVGTPGLAKVTAIVRDCLARLTRVPENQVQLHQPLSDYGMDSLMAAEFAEAIERETAVRLPWIGSTPTSLSTASSRCGREQSPEAASDPSPGSGVACTL